MESKKILGKQYKLFWLKLQAHALIVRKKAEVVHLQLERSRVLIKEIIKISQRIYSVGNVRRDIIVLHNCLR